VSKPGRHTGESDAQLKPIVSCRPNRPRVSAEVVQAVRETAEVFGCSELEAAYVHVQLLHEALEVQGLAFLIEDGRRV